MYARGARLFAGALLLSTAPATALYDNTVNDTGQLAVLSGNTWADDLHLTSPGLVRSVEFGYVANGATEVTISFYHNDATNSVYPGAGATLLFLETLPIQPQSSGLAYLLLDPPLPLPQHVWYAVKFNSFNGAVPLFDPPAVGTSQDVLVRGDGSSWNGTTPRNYFGTGRNNFQVRLGIDIPAPGIAWLAGGSLLALGPRRRRR